MSRSTPFTYRCMEQHVLQGIKAELVCREDGGGREDNRISGVEVETKREMLWRAELGVGLEDEEGGG